MELTKDFIKRVIACDKEIEPILEKYGLSLSAGFYEPNDDECCVMFEDRKSDEFIKWWELDDLQRELRGEPRLVDKLYQEYLKEKGDIK